MAVENYHLRWDSHLTHLNTSIATFYKHDKFADVMLYSSSPDTGFPRVGISAHKLILSTASQFFASIFESTLPTTMSSGVFHIVLPPELTQRTIEILVQYMYSGEATVPNESLNEVLRGGEVLKILGLCRASPNNTEASNETQKSYPHSNPVETNNSIRFDNAVQGLDASVLPESSPVIVNSPKPPQWGLLRIVNCSSLVGGITVNKEVAIDPDPESNMQCAQTVRPSCRESGCTGCPDATDIECPTELVPAPKLTMRTDLHQTTQPIPEKVNDAHNIAYQMVSLPIETPGPQLSQDEQINCLQIKEEPSDCWRVDQSTCNKTVTPVGIPKIVLKLKVPRETVPPPIKIEPPVSCEDDCSEKPSEISERISYTRLVCDICKKSFDEPQAWVRHIESHMEKPEPDKDSDSSSSAFNKQPSKTTVVPKKRRRISPHENSGGIVTLMCDLCKMSFTTPAEWVRHINTQHTESELAMFNNQRNAAAQKKAESEHIRHSRRNQTGGLFKASVKAFHRKTFISQEVRTAPAQDLDKICDVCTKRFVSQSLMMDHRRTHPGYGD